MELLSGPSLAILKVIKWAKFVFNTDCQNTTKYGVSAIFQKKGHAIFNGYYTNGAKLAFLIWHQLGPVSNH